ncbi:hypothetical protein AMJ49_05540 [Parcubacteria bacterium DG_74_2]|nr:MAG: hypothetical protein AMJ49_05540 [Parcubacteria bacterium DG_74_2]
MIPNVFLFIFLTPYFYIMCRILQSYFSEQKCQVQKTKNRQNDDFSSVLPILDAFRTVDRKRIREEMEKKEGIPEKFR